MKILVALGGNALLRRDQAPSADNQLANIRRAAAQLARVAAQHQLIVTHGNGPQVGLLALQAAAYADVAPYPLDVLGAQTEGMIGYLLEQELCNLLAPDRLVCTLLTRVQVDPNDPAFSHPTKPIGPVYTASQSAQAQAAAAAQGKPWVMTCEVPGNDTGDKANTRRVEGAHWRRVVASPKPLKVLELRGIECLLAGGALVIAAGGGGIPVVQPRPGAALEGVEAVIDKDLCAGLLATALAVDLLIIATDVAAVYLDWGLPSQRAVGRVTPTVLAQNTFAAGSMGPKVEAACGFVSATAKTAAIGSLNQIEDLIAGSSGTQVVSSL